MAPEQGHHLPVAGRARRPPKLANGSTSMGRPSSAAKPDRGPVERLQTTRRITAGKSAARAAKASAAKVAAPARDEHADADRHP